MADVTTLAISALYFLLPLFPAWYLHEGTHWVIGKIAGTEPHFLMEHWVVPIGVEHGRIQSIDPWVIRMLGFGIFLWIPILVLSFGYLMIEFAPGTLFITMIPFYVLVVTSESDILAVRDPERYRELEKDGELPGGSPIYGWLLKRVRR